MAAFNAIVGIHIRGQGVGHFVQILLIARTKTANVAVGIHKTGSDALAGSIDHLCTFYRKILSDLNDLAVFYQNISFDNALCIHGIQGAVFDYMHFISSPSL